MPMKGTKCLQVVAVCAAICGCEQRGLEADGFFHGNVEDRDLRVSFVEAERIATIIPEEGTAVRKGELLATLETVRFENEVRAAQARVRSVETQVKTAKNNMDRNAQLVKTRAVALQDADNAEAQYNYVLAEKEVAEAQLMIAEQKIKDSKLYAPEDGVVRKRLLNPGEFTSADRPVLQLALTNPKWVRCYMKETELAKHKLNDAASVKADGCAKPFKAWLGYISPTAEFMPKNIETDELRPMLVYEVRFYVEDPEGILKLGAPVVVECK